FLMWMNFIMGRSPLQEPQCGESLSALRGPRPFRDARGQSVTRVPREQSRRNRAANHSAWPRWSRGMRETETDPLALVFRVIAGSDDKFHRRTRSWPPSGGPLTGVVRYGSRARDIQGFGLVLYRLS